ncbi:MAG: hypothetical protein IJZ68_10615 [Bacteroidaceae bacterium]|nr:hypothetical protein [Bacteroidaceae bacterium]
MTRFRYLFFFVLLVAIVCCCKGKSDGVMSDSVVTDSLCVEESLADSLDSVCKESAGDNSTVALVRNFGSKEEALDFVGSRHLPSPVVHGNWGEYESTFIVAPTSHDCVVELWRATVDEDYATVKDGDGPVVRTKAGQPIVFSYEVPEIIPCMMVVCVNSEGLESSWVPMFSGEDGSLITDSDFVVFE